MSLKYHKYPGVINTWIFLLPPISIALYQLNTFTFRGPLASACPLPAMAFLAFLKMYSRLPNLFYCRVTTIIVSWKLLQLKFCNSTATCRWHIPVLGGQLQLQVIWWLFFEHDRQLHTVTETHMTLSCRYTDTKITLHDQLVRILV